jgi:putative DNA primase/helicase
MVANARSRSERVSAVLADGIRQFVAEFAPDGCSGQVARVARRFGLVAVAGEIATLYGLTGWDKDESSAAVGKCFASWLDGLGGTGNLEERTLLAQVRGFFETNGASRFQDTSSDSQHIVNRAGFFRSDNDSRREFLVLPECFRREVCAGLDPKYAVKILRERGWLLTGNDRATQKIRLPGMGPTWVYVFGARMWEGDEA